MQARARSKYRILWFSVAIALVYLFLGPLVYMAFSPRLTFGEAMALSDRPLLLMRLFITIVIIGFGFYAQLWADRQASTAQVVEHRLRTEELLATISTRFVQVSSQDMDEEIRRTLKQIVAFSRVDRGYICLYSEGHKQIVCVYEWHAEEIESRVGDAVNMSLDAFPWSTQQLEHLQVIHVPKMADLPPEAAPEKAHWESLGIKSLLAIPIAVSGSLAGFLAFDTKHAPTSWTENGIRVLRVVSDILANALLRRRMEELNRRQLTQLEALTRIGLELNAQLDLDALLRSIISQALRLLEASTGAFYLYNPAKDVLEAVAEIGRDDVPIGLRLSRGQGVTGKVLASGEPLIVNDYQHWSERPTSPFKNRWNAVLAVPVRWGGELLGVLSVSADIPKTFSLPDQEILSLFANHVATALRNTRLVKLLQESEERYRVISELTSDHAFSFGVGEQGSLTLRWATEAMTRLLGFPAAELETREKILSFFYPADVLLVREKIEALYQGSPVELEARFMTGKTDLRWLHIVARPIRAKERGRVVELIGSAQDITAEKQTQELERRQLAQLDALRKMSLEITAELDTSQLLAAIVTHAVDLLQVATGGIWLYRPDLDAIELAVPVGPGLAPAGTLLHRGEGVSGRVWESGQPLVVSDYENWEGRAKVFGSYPWSTVMGVPVRYGDQFLGVLGISADAPRVFSDPDAELLGFFAAQAAVAIRNANLMRSLRQSEERFRNTFEQAAVGIAHVSLDGHFVRVNQRYCDIVGYSQEEMLARTFQAITHPDDLQTDLKYVQQTLDGEIPTYAMEKRYLRRDRSLVWVNLTVSLVRETGGRPAYFIAVVENISERKRAEEDLRQSRAKYQALVEASPDAIIVTTLEGALISANSQAAKMHGFASADEMQSSAHNDGLELMSPPDRLRALDMIPKILSAGAARLDGLLLRRDGSTFPGEWNTAVFLGESGAPALIHVVRDITERKRAEEKLLRYAKRLESLHEIDRAILAAWSPEEIAEAALTHIQGLLGCHWVSVALYDYASGQATLLAVKTADGAPLQISAKIEKGARLPLKQITTLDVLLQGRPLIRDDVEAATDLSFAGRLLASQGLRSYMVVPLVARTELMGCLMLGSGYPRAFDAETLQIAQEVASSQAVALQQARLYLQLQADRQQLEMLSMRLLEVQEAERRHVARELHDQIGQMLTGLKLILQIGANSPLAEAREESLRKAQELLDELISDTRELSLDLRPTMLDDLGLIPTLLSHFERYTAHTGIKVEFVHRKLEGKRFKPEVETVAYRVVQEALTNVARYAHVSEARVSLWVERDFVNVQIQDRGVGFDPKSSDSQRNISGLAGMRERVNLLGGKLVIKSAPGGGTTLTARLPLKE